VCGAGKTTSQSKGNFTQLAGTFGVGRQQMASLEQVEQAILVLYGNVRVRNLFGLSSLCIPALPSPRRSESVFKRFRGDSGTVWVKHVPTSPPSNCSADRLA
jgi:hypothetical protein